MEWLKRFSLLLDLKFVGVVKKVLLYLKLQTIGVVEKVHPAPNCNLYHFTSICWEFNLYVLIPLLGRIFMLMDYLLVSLSFYHHMHLDFWHDQISI